MRLSSNLRNNEPRPERKRKEIQPPKLKARKPPGEPRPKKQRQAKVKEEVHKVFICSCGHKFKAYGKIQPKPCIGCYVYRKNASPVKCPECDLTMKLPKKRK